MADTDVFPDPVWEDHPCLGFFIIFYLFFVLLHFTVYYATRPSSGNHFLILRGRSWQKKTIISPYRTDQMTMRMVMRIGIHTSIFV